MTTGDHLLTSTRMPETIVATDAIEQLSPFAPHFKSTKSDRVPEAPTRDYRWSGLGTAQTLTTAIPIVFGDLLALLFSNYLMAFVVAYFLGSSVHANYLWQGVATGLIYLGAGFLMGLYPGTAMSPVYELKHTITNCWLAFAATLALNQLLATLTFRESAIGVAAAILASVLVPVTRNSVRQFFARYRWWGERVIIIGSGVQGQAIYRFYRRSPHRGLKPVGLVDSAEFGGDNVPAIKDPMICYLGSIDNIDKLAKRHCANWAIIAPGGCDELNLSQVVSACGVFQNLVILPTGLFLPSLWSSTRECAGVIGVHVRDHLRSPFPRFIKRLSDIVGSLLALLLFSPIIFAAVLWIKLKSPGPVFYGQERVGRNGQRFTAWKFRTMVVNAEQVLDQYLENDYELRQEWITYQKLRNDPRIIQGVGTFLRKSSMDELPQLWNVLKGDMSLVGPRPCMESQINLYKETYPLYLRVRPGITGLWQISGRNETSYDQRVRFDGYYVCNWSLWLDAYILIRTIRTILWREGAY